MYSYEQRKYQVDFFSAFYTSRPKSIRTDAVIIFQINISETFLVVWIYCWWVILAFICGGDRGWNSWISSLTQWTWVWANSRRQGRTRKLGVLLSIGSKRVGHDWATEQQCLKSSFPHPLLFLKDVFIRYTLLSSRFFSLSTLKMLLDCISCIFFQQELFYHLYTSSSLYILFL